MKVRELYRQLKPFVEMCPDQDITIEAGNGVRYPVSVDRSDYGEREVVIYAVRPGEAGS